MKRDILYPLRRLHGCREKLAFWKFVNLPLRKKVYVLGTPAHTNIGDSAIALAEQWFLQKAMPDRCVKEFTTQETERCNQYLMGLSKRNGKFCWHGGGNMGDLWQGEENLRRICLAKQYAERPVVLPQTFCYSDSEKGQAALKASVPFYNRSEVTVVAREEPSFRLMQKAYPKANVLLAPDIVLFSRMQDYGVTPQERSGVLFCARSDPEKAVAESVWTELERLFADKGVEVRHTDMYSDCEVTKKNRLKCVRSKMQQFCCAQMVITDRLHGMIFAALTGTPCIVFSNYNHKVKGTYEWISYLSYIRYVETPEEAKAAIPDLLMMTNCHFDNTPLMPYFEELANVVKEKCLK